MDIHRELFAFAASAGALEGFAFPEKGMEAGRLRDWTANLVAQYRSLPAAVRRSIQPDLDRTLGRAVLSLIPVLGEEDPDVKRLKSLIQGDMPRSFRDFKREIREKAARFTPSD